MAEGDTEQCAKIVARNQNLCIEDYMFLVKNMVNSGLGSIKHVHMSIVNEVCLEFPVVFHLFMVFMCLVTE